ncbi:MULTISPECIES: lipid-A-disaccharide synthase [Alphaproteobacteria]|uniref:Lipid-A-disaccharide synthase n=2 Tax=Alphaproteobacteria TaxID=28211 RepID=A0A512HHM7_9HYPH|nr:MULTISPECIES: lipid-A-disaccharide synthase [Alphaproteobacteria]GEO84955.1 lipid-A-disaccharide synthase [Ciceribacter naphthalenivorans]GLR22889.1 lipid-A-disaccharide synthase [Ciceribacter naphthalenivorans]GLT05745.1 lipid-A-disaccharide synthase [Sphingomonas psychrolutea]
MTGKPLKVAVIAGEVSGDLLGADLVAALKVRHSGPIELFGVGGDALERQGLTSLFDFSELSVMGITQVLSRLPRFIRLIGLTAKAIVKAKPDLLLIVDSPDFTHRVAKKVRQALPDLPVVDYVCPSVWAWKEYRAKAMMAYVDEVLAVLPFEPQVMRDLGGPPTHFVGHRLTTHARLVETRHLRNERAPRMPGEPHTIVLLPGSRGAEVSLLLPVFGGAVREFVARNGPTRFLLPTVPRQEQRVRAIIADWPDKPEILLGDDAKWQAFAEADAAMAASGTVILELALATVPVVSAYKTDWLIRLLSSRIKTWTGALPNLIADYAVVPEYVNDVVRPASLVRWAERLSSDSLQRRAMLEGYDLAWQRLQTERPAGEEGASIVLDLLTRRGVL